MDGRYDPGSEVGLEPLSSLAGDAERRSKKRLRSGRSEADKNVWPNETQFCFKAMDDRRRCRESSVFGECAASHAALI